MIGSTEEFLSILRSGNYIWAIIEWKNFCIQKYQEFNGDTLHLLLLYELINHKYLPSDLDHVLNLCILCKQIEEPQEGFVFMVDYLRAAATLYTIYHNKDILYFFTPPDPLTLSKDAILTLMNQPVAQLSNEELNKLFAKSDKQIERAIPLLQKEPARQMQLKKQRMNFLKEIGERYLLLLNTLTLDENGKKRKDLVDALVVFIDLSLDTPWTREKIKEYVESIDKYKPEKWEKDYLNQLHVPSYVSRMEFFVRETIMNWITPSTNTPPTC